MNQVTQLFLGTDMRCGHEGLEKIAKKRGVNVSKIEAGTFIVFINAGKDRLKLYAANNVIAYYKTRKGERLELGTIPLILRAFNSTGRIDYDAALKETIEKHLSRRTVS